MGGRSRASEVQYPKRNGRDMTKLSNAFCFTGFGLVWIDLGGGGRKGGRKRRKWNAAVEEGKV